MKTRFSKLKFFKSVWIMWEYFDTFVMMWDKLPELKFFQEPA